MFTNDQLDVLIKISKEGQNIQKRWEALKAHPVNIELQLTKEDFLESRGLRKSSMERRLREYVSVNKKTNHDDLRRALDHTKDESPVYGLYSKVNKRKESSGMGALLAIVMLIAVPMYFFIQYLSRVEIANREYERRTSETTSSIDECVESSRYESACKVDPVFTYCGIAEPNVLGSGCTSRIKNAGDFQAQAAMCIAELGPIVRQQCVTEIYGCSAATGKVDC